MAEIYDLAQGAGLPIWFPIGITLIIIGMLFKIAAAPFHFWAPDVYEGSPSMTTATMSTLAKVVAMATLYKLLSGLTSLSPKVELLIVILSILSMSVGNIMALRQKNVKRMLAFSGVSHAGFMVMALLSMSTAASTLLYYTAAYALAGIASFAVIIYVTKNNDNEDISNFNGLGKNNPLLAALLTASLLSMAGIPIFSGFFAKFMLFEQTIKAGYLVVVIAAVINSIISVGYYFKLILAMYTKEVSEERQAVPFVYYAVAIIAILLNIILGIYPSFVANLLS
jgi:NADH-quinone oxidoreductase subunit N